jgi:two-component system, OmpR family, phosphate regulon sensor histidine kinase PhoR
MPGREITSSARPTEPTLAAEPSRGVPASAGATAHIATDFVTFATHQLRTPLSGVKWLLELAARDEGLGEETRSYIADARDATERLIRLVNEMLTLSRLESGRLPLAREPLGLDEVTRVVLDEVGPLVRDKELQVSTVGLAGVPKVVGDPHFVRQVVLTLLSNAVKYSAPGGPIGIALHAGASEAVWSVRDAGVGIPRPAQPHVFEKFFRADNVLTLDTEGLGLGLCLSKLVVEQLGGRIAFVSTEGEGSTFTFTLPLAE